PSPGAGELSSCRDTHGWPERAIASRRRPRQDGECGGAVSAPAEGEQVRGARWGRPSADAVVLGIVLALLTAALVVFGPGQPRAAPVSYLEATPAAVVAPAPGTFPTTDQPAANTARASAGTGGAPAEAAPTGAVSPALPAAGDARRAQLAARALGSWGRDWDD